MKRFSKALVQRRLLIMFLVILASTIFFGFRLAYLQLWQNEFFQTKALEQRMQSIPVEGLRGTIYDRNGIPLALSVSAHTVFAVPIEVESPEETASLLAAILDLEPDFILKRLKKRSSVEWLKKKVTDEEAKQILRLGLPGIGLVPTSTRIYPYGSIAPQVLGFVGIDNQGLEGIELQYDEFLRGRPGQAVFERDAHGRALEDGVRGFLPGERFGDFFALNGVNLK
ncbi:MAG TPA: stage V sporulation protein D, partial [Firmicutes bacterium]|nr:stage V sporulation protein D [Bacillota bacterium]